MHYFTSNRDDSSMQYFTSNRDDSSMQYFTSNRDDSSMHYFTSNRDDDCILYTHVCTNLAETKVSPVKSTSSHIFSNETISSRSGTYRIAELQQLRPPDRIILI